MHTRKNASGNFVRFCPRLETLERRVNPSVSTAFGDINADGVDDLISGTGPGQNGQVTILNGVDGSLICQFAPFAGFQGGLVVSAGQFRGNSNSGLEVVVGARAGGGPRVDIFQITPAYLFSPFGSAQRIGGLFAFDKTFTGGVSIGTGDTDGNGKADLVVGAGPGGGPHVKVFKVLDDGQSDLVFTKIDGFYAYPEGFMGGVQVAVGNLNSDTRNEIVTGAGKGGTPHVKVFEEGTHNQLASFYAFDKAFRGGVFVGTGNYNSTPGATIESIVTGAGEGGGPRVSVFDIPENKTNPPVASQNFFAFGNPALTGGVRVSGSKLAPVKNGLIATTINQPGNAGTSDIGSVVNVYPGAYQLGSSTPVPINQVEPFPDPNGNNKFFGGFSFSVSIPLTWVNSAATGSSPTFRLGVNAIFPNSQTTGSYTYLLDTGSTGVYVPWQIATGGSTAPGGTTFVQNYGSGIQYTAVNQAGTVQFSDTQGNNYGVQGTVNYASVVQSTKWTDQTIVQDLQSNTPPNENAFWGTFGMDTQASSTSPGSIFNSLIQMPGNLGMGFIVNSGGNAIFNYANQLPSSEWVQGVISPTLLAQLGIPTPTLTIGLNSYTRSGFTMVSPPVTNPPTPPQNYQNPDGSTYTNGSFTPIVLNDKSLNSTINIIGSGGPPLPYNSGTGALYTVFDTGEANSTLYTELSGNIPNSLVNSQYFLNPGLAFVQTVPNPQSGVTPPPGVAPNPVSMSFTTGTVSNQNLVAYSPASRNSFNTGIAFFLQYQVMYDIQNTAMGFQAIAIPAG